MTEKVVNRRKPVEVAKGDGWVIVQKTPPSRLHRTLRVFTSLSIINFLIFLLYRYLTVDQNPLKVNALPCQDFAAFACQNEIKAYKNGLTVKVLEEYDDFVLKKLHEERNKGNYEKATIRSCYARARRTFLATEDSRQRGRMAAFGNDGFMKIDVSVRDRRFTLEIPEQYKAKAFKSSIEIDEFIDGYLEVMDVEKKYEPHNFARSTHYTKRLKFHSHSILYLLDVAPYLNLYYADKYLQIDPLMVRNPVLLARAEEVKNLIVNETISQIQVNDWMHHDDKISMKYMLEDIKFMFGPPIEYTNSSLVKESLRLHQQFFSDHYNNTKNMKLMGLDGDECLGAYYTLLLRTASRIFAFQHDDFDFVPTAFKDSMYSPSFFAPQALNIVDSHIIAIGVPELNYLLKGTSLGFTLGTLGQTLGHELFHSLGVDGINMVNGDVIVKTDRFQKAVKCYEYFYGNLTRVHCTYPPWKLFFASCEKLTPDGAKKANEGFADVESVRIGIRIIERNVASLWSRQMELSTFFSALSLSFCPRWINEKTNWEVEKHILEKEFHPRYDIRLNAMMMQLPEFSEHFQCRDKDPMYRREELCRVYT
ncbi:hypothetical protein QR680_014067 [Steinernema hermaphroditum]|uniref:Peptidase M13 C-terminal domain-containing protein n=1 Tax=Steinernema hermaphroditum TaxID=289476 RepID=A0AA39I9N6_9BILA|nr:hypothetical protein QR680_014067 [Steinernema hermaphroditum]